MREVPGGEREVRGVVTRRAAGGGIMPPRGRRLGGATGNPQSPIMTSTELRHTPLHTLHLEHGAKITPFAGYAMPLHYGGIIGEHLHVRKAAGCLMCRTWA